MNGLKCSWLDELKLIFFAGKTARWIYNQHSYSELEKFLKIPSTMISTEVIPWHGGSKEQVCAVSVV